MTGFLVLQRARPLVLADGVRVHAVGAQHEDETLAGPDPFDDLLVPGVARTQAMPILFELVEPDTERRVASLERVAMRIATSRASTRNS
jgi:hypothetical protein